MSNGNVPKLIEGLISFKTLSEGYLKIKTFNFGVLNKCTMRKLRISFQFDGILSKKIFQFFDK